MLTNKIPLRFYKSIDVDMLTGTTVAFYLEDTMGDLPDIRFTDVEDFREYWKAIEKEFYEVYSEIRQLKIENRKLNDENKELKEELLEVIDTLGDNRSNKKGFMGNGRFA